MKKPKGMWELNCMLIVVAVSIALMASLAMDAPVGSEVTIHNHAQANGVTLEDYPASLVALLEQNPETEEFVLNYPFRQELPIDLSDLDLSQGVPLLMQWDPRWGYMKYGSDLVGITGSGPLCLSMAGYYLTEDPRFYPDAVVRFAKENDYCTTGIGSTWTLISRGAEELGLEAKEIAPEEKKVAAYLNSGAVIIAIMGPGDFTSAGHFIVVTGYADGMVSVNDPNSYANSEKLWEFAAIKSQFRNLWVITQGEEQ